MKNRRFKFFCFPVVIIFILNTVLPVELAAQVQPSALGPKPYASLTAYDLQPTAVLKGMTIDVKNPLKFEFIMSSSNAPQLSSSNVFIEDPASSEEKTLDSGLKHSRMTDEKDAMKLIHYFLAALTTPEDQLWVNLSPNEPNRILPHVLDQTQMGEDLIGQDYLLKQLTASLLQPENEIGKKFWESIYQKTREQGITDIPVDLKQKVWIVPDIARVAVRNHSVFITEAKLKVMTEEEYSKVTSNGKREMSKNSTRYALPVSRFLEDIILPAIEKEINEGEQFAQLRQMYQAMILASWYKKNLKKSLLGQAYVNQQKTDGINTVDPHIKDQLYQKYLDLFRSRTNQLIKEEYDPQTQNVVSKQYISGGYSAAMLDVGADEASLVELTEIAQETQTVTFELHPQQTSSSKTDGAMMADSHVSQEILEYSDAVNLGIPTGRTFNALFRSFKKAPPIVRHVLMRKLNDVSDDHQRILRERVKFENILLTWTHPSLINKREDSLRMWQHVSQLIVDFEDSRKILKRAFFYMRAVPFYDEKEMKYSKLQVYLLMSSALSALSRMTYILLTIEQTLSDMRRNLQDSGVDPKFFSETSFLGQYQSRVKSILAHSELQFFIERKEFQGFSALHEYPFALMDEDVVEDAQEKYNHIPGWEESLEDVDEVIEDLHQEGTFDVLKRQFDELYQIFSQKDRELWRRDDKPGGLDSSAQSNYIHQYLNSFSSGAMNILSQLDYYVRLSWSIADGSFVFADISDSKEGIILEDFYSPLLLSQESYTRKDNRPTSWSVQAKASQKMIFLSGPNRGGKTTLARDIAWAVFLNQAGLPLAAKDARLPLFKHIYTVFPQSDQVQPGQGYFATLLKKIHEIIVKAKPNDLIILDEVPTGTDYNELVAVTVTLLEALEKTGATVVVTSHLKKALEIFLNEHPSETLALQTTVEVKDQQVVPDFRLKEGIADHSRAISLARTKGFPPSIIAAAQAYYLQIIDSSERLEIAQMSLDDQDVPETQDDSSEPDPMSPQVEISLKDIFDRKFFGFNRSFWDLTDKEKFSTPLRIIQRLAGVKNNAYITDELTIEQGEHDLRFLNISVEDRRNVLKFLENKSDVQLENVTKGIADFVDILDSRSAYKPKNGDQIHAILEKIILNLNALLANDFLFDDERLSAQVHFLRDVVLKDIQDIIAKYPAGQETLAIEQIVNWGSDWRKLSSALISVLSVLDELVGSAHAFQALNFSEPQWASESNILKIENMMPVIDRKQRVPQSFEIHSDLPVMVITGSNSSGKSVATFNTYLNVLLALNGFYVSGRMTMSRFDHVTGVFGGDNIAGSEESYFSNILLRYAKVLREATDKSFVILDELNGTDNFELAALQLAILQYLRLKGATVMFNTHIRDGLKEAADQLGFAIWTTEINFDAQTGRLIYQYTLVPDPELKAQSYAFEIAAQYLTSEQMARVQEIYQQLVPNHENNAMLGYADQEYEESEIYRDALDLFRVIASIFPSDIGRSFIRDINDQYTFRGNHENLPDAKAFRDMKRVELMLEAAGQFILDHDQEYWNLTDVQRADIELYWNDFLETHKNNTDHPMIAFLPKFEDWIFLGSTAYASEEEFIHRVRALRRFSVELSVMYLMISGAHVRFEYGPLEFVDPLAVDLLAQRVLTRMNVLLKKNNPTPEDNEELWGIAASLISAFTFLWNFSKREKSIFRSAQHIKQDMDFVMRWGMLQMYAQKMLFAQRYKKIDEYQLIFKRNKLNITLDPMDFHENVGDNFVLKIKKAIERFPDLTTIGAYPPGRAPWDRVALHALGNNDIAGMAYRYVGRGWTVQDVLLSQKVWAELAAEPVDAHLQYSLEEEAELTGMYRLVLIGLFKMSEPVFTEALKEKFEIDQAQLFEKVASLEVDSAMMANDDPYEDMRRMQEALADREEVLRKKLKSSGNDSCSGGSCWAEGGDHVPSLKEGIKDKQQALDKLAQDGLSETEKARYLQNLEYANQSIRVAQRRKAQGLSDGEDWAMLSRESAAKGGIDFNADKMNLQEDGAPMAFDMPLVDSAQLQNINGFVPVILSIRPTDVKALLGLL